MTQTHCLSQTWHCWQMREMIGSWVSWHSTCSMPDHDDNTQCVLSAYIGPHPSLEARNLEMGIASPISLKFLLISHFRIQEELSMHKWVSRSLKNMYLHSWIQVCAQNRQMLHFIGIPQFQSSFFFLSWKDSYFKIVTSNSIWTRHKAWRLILEVKIVVCSILAWRTCEIRWCSCFKERKRNNYCCWQTYDCLKLGL